MKKSFIPIALLAAYFSSYAQTGYPERENIQCLYEKFVNPPVGYGEVPFYWWQGDTLTRERLTWHLDEMAKKHVTSLQINYSHDDDKTKSYFWGASVKSQPAQFTDEWWDLFSWFTQEAAKRNMTVSVSDYTLGIGQGYAFDEVIRLHPDIHAEELIVSEIEPESGTNDTYILPTEEKMISVIAFCGNDLLDLTKNVKNGKLKWKAPDKRDWKVVTATSEVRDKSYNPMHPLAGKEYVRCFFQRFEDKVPASVKNNLNFFFSDELNFNIPSIVWDSRFAGEFQKRKGYDIRPYLAALKMDIGDKTTDIRLDYNDVFTSLCEENFFIPVYNWHADRGLIYGCDHGGRGRRVDEFGDYFRTQRWNQGPGSDQPNFQKDVIKAKVAASISHLYNRPRVWLEGFYGSGWGTTTQALMDAIYSNFAMGYNLLSLHGLYYGTPDSRWEWAPPCNHFRMPYWPHMDQALKTVERLSYILSQGYHSCDIGIIYPVEPKVAGFGNDAVNAAFDAAKGLYDNGIDLDFIDYSSMADAKIDGKDMVIANERYKAIVVPPMEVMRESTKQKLKEFEEKGGKVINLVKNSKPDSLISIFDRAFCRDFKTLDKANQSPYIHHRKIDDKELFAIYNVDKDMPCFFRAKGDVELWDLMDGSKYKLTNTQTTDEGTIVKMPKEKSNMQILVFTPQSDAKSLPLEKERSIILTLANEWDCEILPVLNNQFGDFHYPGSAELIKPEIRHYRYIASDKSKISKGSEDDFFADAHEITYTYGEEMLNSGATAEILSDAALASMSEAPSSWKPYEFSRKWGVLGDAGHQGYHGLKSIQNPEVIRLGEYKREGTATKRLEEKEGRNYYLFTTVNAPYDGEYEILTGDVKPSRCFVNGSKLSERQETVKLKKGINPIVLHYDGPTISYFFIRDPKQITTKDQKFALQWHDNPSILAFDPYGGKGLRYGWYCFQSAPGLESFTVGTKGTLSAWVDGKAQKVNLTNDGLNHIVLSNTQDQAVPVVLRIEMPFGIKGGNAISSELVQNTGKGKISTGDWGLTDGLRNYSGGVIYRQNINIPLDGMKDNRIFLCADSIVSSAELRINGKDAGVRLNPDWKFDISDFVVDGDNQIEITVYNTAANHYETIPTPYVKPTPSGIIGKVWLEN